MKNLIIGSVGKDSCHKQWISNPYKKNFNLVLVSYEGTDYSDDCEQVFLTKGFKYECVYKLCTEKHIRYSDYDAIMLLDDDLSISTPQLSRCFDLFHEHNLLLAQPSLDPRSYYSHRICVTRPEWKLRFTNFVECMCPIFSKEAFEICLPTFQEAPMGTAIDWVWPMLLGYPKDRIGIIDAIRIVHTRPVRGEYSEYSFDDRKYYTDIQTKYNPPEWFMFRAYGALKK